jgi:hypothetical protein
MPLRRETKLHDRAPVLDSSPGIVRVYARYSPRLRRLRLSQLPSAYQPPSTERVWPLT